MKILIVKLSSIGDVVHTLPALALVRRALPEAQIDWAVERGGAAEILRGNLYLNRLVEIDTRALRRRKFSTETLFLAREQLRQLRIDDYDAAIDFQGLIKSAAIARLARAGRRYGFAKQNLREPSSRFLLSEAFAAAPRIHVIEKNVTLAREALNIERGERRAAYEFPIFTEDVHEREAEKIINDAGANFAILNPAGGWATKLWSAEKFGALADALWAENRLVSVVATATNEIELARKVLRSSKSGKVFLAQPSLKGFYELAKRAALYVGGDTAPTHLAVAARAPVVGIFGATEWWRNGSPNEADICVERVDISCRENCHRRACANWICMNIETETVLRAAQKRLELAATREDVFSFA